jgi:predicted RecB family nuclease
MNGAIASEVVEAYSHCPRKAFLLMSGQDQAVPTDYIRMTEEQAAANRKAYRGRLMEAGHTAGPSGPTDLTTGREVLVDAVLSADGLEARCDALTRVGRPLGPGGAVYEPVKVIGAHRVTKAQTIGLAFLGYVLGRLQHHPPAAGTLVRAGDRPCRVKLAGKYKEVRSIVASLKAWANEPACEAPPVVLNKHCPCCPFRDACRQRAEQEDSLSLLDRMTPKLMRQYHAKGIFTVQQLSHLFRPRRSRKKGKRTVRHSLELQALAIRTGKTYVEHLPDLSRRPVELFVDVEGVPDQNSFYLIGLLTCAGDDIQYHAFWADGPEDEARIWQEFVGRVASFPDAPLYHYGSYERKAFKTLTKRHGGGREVANRLVNVASSVYGRVYFPIRSNGLKVLGRFLGAAWTAAEASGLMSLVWRHKWEATRENQYRAALLRYNREDCEAARLLVARLMQIKETAASEPAVDFAHRPKQTATELGREVHRQFERILMNAQEGGQRRSVRVRGDTGEEGEPKKKGAPIGHQAFRRTIPSKVSRTVLVAPKRRCPSSLLNSGLF